MARTRQRRTRFDNTEYERLARDLARDPLLVLSHFKSLGIDCLAELGCWRDLCRYQPDSADNIRYVAGLLDIPERIGKE